MRHHKEGKRRIVEYDSVGDWVDHVCAVTKDGHRSHVGGEEFTGTKTWDEAVGLALYGWKEGLELLHGEYVELSEHLMKENEQTAYRWDLTGLALDIPTMLTGNPEHWLNAVPITARKGIRIEVNISTSGATNQGAIIKRGAAICALIDSLQEHGYIVELSLIDIGLNVMHSNDGYVSIEIGQTPLDMDQVAFAIAHPSSLRRLAFASHEFLFNTDDCGGYGCPSNDPRPLPPQTLRIPCLEFSESKKFSTVESSAKWVKEQVELAMKTSVSE